MKILIIDNMGLAVDWAIQCQAYGHEVFLWIDKTDAGKINKIGDGLVPKIKRWQDKIEWADLVFVANNVCELEELDKWHKKKRIIGPTFKAAQLELARQVGQDAFKAAGIDVMDCKTFKDYDKAIEYVKTEQKRFVSKPDGDADKALSYVSKSPRDMVFMLEKWQKIGKCKENFILQEFNPGIEMAVGGWFGPHGFNEYVCENFEHKKLMNGEIGVNTGEMGTCLKYTKKSLLADLVLYPLEKLLKSLNYVGFVDVAVIIDKEGTPWPLEFTCRPGWPLFNIQTSLHIGDPAQWMWDLAGGKDTMEVSEEIASGVIVAIPNFPFSEQGDEKCEGFPIYNVESCPEDIHFCEVMMGSAPDDIMGEIIDVPMIVTAGSYVLVATGTDLDVVGSVKRAYRAIKKIEIPNSPMYRTDIGKRLKDQLPDLQDMGYAEDWKYE